MAIHGKWVRSSLDYTYRRQRSLLSTRMKEHSLCLSLRERQRTLTLCLRKKKKQRLSFFLYFSLKRVRERGSTRERNTVPAYLSLRFGIGAARFDYAYRIESFSFDSSHRMKKCGLGYSYRMRRPCLDYLEYRDQVLVIQTK